MTETKTAPCPICDQPAKSEWKPFCSKRCADIDLGKWFTGSYAIAGEPADQADDTPYEGRDEE